MPIYEYVCTECTINEIMGPFRIQLQIAEYNQGFAVRPPSCRCGAELKHKFSFAIKPSMPDHYNTSAGTYVSSERQLNDEFKRLSDEASARVGMEHRFVPVDPRDKDRLGVTDAGLKETYDRRKQLGMKIPEVVRPENMT